MTVLVLLKVTALMLSETKRRCATASVSNNRTEVEVVCLSKNTTMPPATHEPTVTAHTKQQTSNVEHVAICVVYVYRSCEIKRGLGAVFRNQLFGGTGLGNNHSQRPNSVWYIDCEHLIGQGYNGAVTENSDASPSARSLKRLCATRWIAKYDAVHDFIGLLEYTLEALQEICRWNGTTQVFDGFMSLLESGTTENERTMHEYLTELKAPMLEGNMTCKTAIGIIIPGEEMGSSLEQQGSHIAGERIEQELIRADGVWREPPAPHMGGAPTDCVTGGRPLMNLLRLLQQTTFRPSGTFVHRLPSVDFLCLNVEIKRGKYFGKEKKPKLKGRKYVFRPPHATEAILCSVNVKVILPLVTHAERLMTTEAMQLFQANLVATTSFRRRRNHPRRLCLKLSDGSNGRCVRSNYPVRRGKWESGRDKLAVKVGATYEPPELRNLHRKWLVLSARAESKTGAEYSRRA
ncbi:hypothetical protein PR048_030290 [Dryococelus australis]|uniref:Uncharacterized protein n=1 Tax=Dryococelus australis TaxID=614101 RepID=A0ABQ9G8K6_9NEOP|nr:hypothetical protein PR048_030290 [Dryococelus australis]